MLETYEYFYLKTNLFLFLIICGSIRGQSDGILTIIFVLNFVAQS